MTVQPSTEAIDAAAHQRKMCRMDSTADILTAAYAIDAPAIHAAGVAEGRAAMRDEIVTWARSYQTFSAPSLADAIEAAFPTTTRQNER